MWLSILPNKDLEELRRIAGELKKGNITEKKLAMNIERYTNNRTERIWRDEYDTTKT